MSPLPRESLGRSAWLQLAQVLEEEAAYCRGVSPLYHALFTHLHTWVREIGEGGDESDRWQVLRAALTDSFLGRTFNYRYEPVLLLAASIHRHVLTGNARGLGRYYATVGGSFDPASQANELGVQLRELLRDPSQDLGKTLARQRLQTNAVVRSFVWLLPYLALDAREAKRRPCTLVELGCSAGLNLIADRFAWRPSVGDCERVAVEGATGPVLRVRMHGELGWLEGALGRRLDELAPIVQRLGCDLHVPRLDDAEERLALESCVWGDKPAKLAELRDAARCMQHFRSQGGHVELAERDAGPWIADAAALADEAQTVILFNSIVTTYLDDREYERLKRSVADAMRGAWRGRRCYWFELEPPRNPSELEGAPAASEAVIRVHTLLGEALHTRTVAFTQMHPHEVTWLDTMNQLCGGNDG